MKKLLISLLVLGFLWGGAYFAFSLVKKSVENGEIRATTEERFSKVFGAKVSVGKIQLKFLHRLSFSDFKFDKGYLMPNFAITGVERIVFGYGWKSLINGNLRAPKNILLKNANFQLDSFNLSDILFHWNFLQFAGNIPSVKIDGGSMFWSGKNQGDKSGLEHLDGVINKKGPDEVSLRFKGDLAGQLKGQVFCEGKVSPKSKKADLLIRLNNVRHDSSDMSVFHDLNGTLRVKDSTLIIEELRFSVSSLNFIVRGTIENLNQPDPKFHLEIKELSKGFGGEASLAVDGDFKTRKIWGAFIGLGSTFPFRGELIRSALGLNLKELKIGSEITADTELLYENWMTHMKIARGKERYDVRFSLNDFHINLDFNVDHLQLFDFDIVTMAHIAFVPKVRQWNHGLFQFDASLSTDYFVFDYEPLEDFKGNFVLSGEGIRDLNLVWGKGYKTTGEIIFGKPPLVALDINADKIILSEVTKFGFHSLPENLTGMMDGKISIRGEAQQPEISGHFSVGSGSVKALTFDNLLLSFYGNRHYLKLKDSKITRGAKTYYVKGDIDFSSRNIFSGVEVITESHIPVWSGKNMGVNTPASPSQGLSEDHVAQIKRAF